MKRIGLLVLLVLLGSCNRETAKVLDEAESCMQAYPDSALSLIRNIDTTTLVRPAMKARFALLHAMALDKNWIDTTDVGVVMPAVEYYGNQWPLTKRVKPYYYLGRIQYNGGNYADAIISFTRANECAKSLKDARFRSLIFQAIGDTYGSTYLFEDAIRYTDSSYTYCMMAGDTALAYSSLYRKAQLLNNIKQFAAADSILRFLLENESCLYPQVVPKVMADKAFVLVNQNRDYDFAKELFEKANAMQGGLPGVNYWCAYGYVLSVLGEKEKSRSIFKQLEKSPAKDSYVFKVWSSKIAALEGDYETAFSDLEESAERQMALLRETLHQSSLRAQRDYNALERTRAEESRRFILWISILAVISLLTVGIVVYLLLQRKSERIMRKNRALEMETASLKEALASFSDQVSELKLQQARLQREYTRHLQSSFRGWSQLYKAYYHTKDMPIDVRDNVFFEAKKAIAMLADDDEGQLLLEQRLNELFSDVMKHYRAEFPGKEEREYHFVSFVFAGFDASVLKTAFSISTLPAAYERKSRLKDTIARSKVPHKDEFLLFFR